MAILNVTDSRKEMYFKGDGSIGIGTTSPSEKLHVTGNLLLDSSDAEINIKSGVGGTIGAVNWTFDTTSTNYAAIKLPYDTRASIGLHIDSGYPITIDATTNTDFDISGSTKMRLNATGLGIGTTNPSTPLHVVKASGDVLTLNRTGSDGGVVSIRNDGTEVGTITFSGSTTSYNTSSDARLKDITGSARGLAVINELNPVAYDWKADGKSDEGLIAQEVLGVVSNAVSGSEKDMYQMDYSKLVVHLVKGMQEQQEQIESLKSEIQLLKGGN